MRHRFRVLARLGLLALLGLGLLPTTLPAAGITVIDAHGQSVTLERPAQRIVSLSPHLTELLFAAGAGDRIIATVEHADYPPAALAIPRIGQASQLDLERILAARPDLIVAWSSGSPRAQLERLERLGLVIYYSEATDFDGIAEALRHLGHLAGTDTQAEAVAREFLQAMADLQHRHAGQAPVSVFYQVWDRPLMTVNDQHLIGEIIALCGGRNVFGDLDTLVPRPGRETILAADPEAIVVGGPGEDRPDWLDAWRRWDQLTAVRRDNLFFISPSLLQRHTPRIAEGTRQLCAALELARSRRADPTR